MMGPRARTITGHGNDASAEHRRKLEALFGGGSLGVSDTPTPSLVAPAMALAAAAPAPSTMRSQRTFAAPRRQVNRRPSEYSMRLERLRIAREPDAIREAADVFLAHHQLPDDMDVLLKVLQHPSEKVLCNVMGQISYLLNQRRAPRATIILVDRLREIGARAICAATRCCIEGLQQQIHALSAS